MIIAAFLLWIWVAFWVGNSRFTLKLPWGMGQSGSMNHMMMNGWVNSDAMKEHCKMMPEMPGCEKYSQTSTGSSEETLNTQILTDDRTTKDETPTEVVNLKNGDVYDITVEKVRKVIRGKSIVMLSYNGSIPWPIIRVPKGSQITLKVHNSVTWLETTIHPHGLRLDNKYDGVPRTQWGFQDPIKAWAVYEQKLTFPDTGIFWYHPHTRDDFEQELGEYGTIVVYDSNEKRTFDSENVWVIDDILLDNWKIPDYLKEDVNHTLMGRYGNTFMINGKTNYNLNMKAWEVKKLYILNSANARPFRISIPWIKIKRIWGDNGYYQKEEFIDSLIIAPAERYIVDIYAEKAWTYTINHTGVGKPVSLGMIQVNENSGTKDIYKTDFLNLGTRSILENIPNLESYFTKKADKSITLQMSMKGMEWMGNMWGMMSMWDNDTIEWEDTMAMMNARSTDKSITWEIVDDATQKKNMDIKNWTFKKGSLVKIHIYNDPNTMHAMQHPFHMHGQRFLILDTNGKKTDNFVWKDTVLIPKGDSVDILVDMSNPWVWMAHCHIVEHLLSGMMMDYTVTQ